MKVTTNTNLIKIFSGTYNTGWEVSECDGQGNECELDYKHSDLMQSILEEYQADSQIILDEMGVSFIKKMTFTGHYSPREYNFANDGLDFTIDVDPIRLCEVIGMLQHDQKFSKYLKDNYTSYDGFMSFTPNTWEGINEQILTQGDEFEQSLGAIINYLMLDGYGSEFIEGDRLESWLCNGYQGLDYKIVKTCDKCGTEINDKCIECDDLALEMNITL